MGKILCLGILYNYFFKFIFWQSYNVFVTCISILYLARYCHGGTNNAIAGVQYSIETWVLINTLQGGHYTGHIKVQVCCYVRYLGLISCVRRSVIGYTSAPKSATGGSCNQIAVVADLSGPCLCLPPLECAVVSAI